MKLSIHPALNEKLIKQKKLYVKVTEFAKLLPSFEETIIENEFTADKYCRLGYHHGKLPLDWNINWYTNTPTNYPKEKLTEVGLVNVYINCMSLFGDNCYQFGHQELTKVLPEIKVHFYDHWNSTFYFLPEEARDGLDKLEQWYISTKEKTQEYLKNKRLEELRLELEKLGG